MEPHEPLSLESKPGVLVTWTTLDGAQHIGRLVEFDNGTAIITMRDGTEKAVRCA